MTLKQLIQEASLVGYQLTTADIPVKIDGKEALVLFRLHFDGESQPYVSMEVNNEHD